MTNKVERCLWVLVSGTLALMIYLSRDPGERIEAHAWAPTPAEPSFRHRADLGDLAARVVKANPFRLDRGPAPLPFGSPESISPAHTAGLTPRVTGIIGPPWRAALENLSGQSGGLLVSAGDSVGAWRVHAVGRDEVEMRLAATVLRLRLERP